MRFLLAALLLAAALAMPGAAALAQDAGTAEAAPEAPAEATLSEAQRPQLTLSVEPENDIHVGDRITVRLTADAPAGSRVRVPKQDLAPFELLERDSRTESLPDGRERHVFELSLTHFEAGEATLPALEVRVVAPDQTLGSVHTEPRTLSVLSRVANEPNAEPRAATKPVEVIEDDYTLAWVGGGLLAALLLAALGYGYARYRARQPKAVPPPPPPRPPWDLALEKLDALQREREAWLNDGRAAEYVDAVSDVVREYLGDRYDFDGLESTTDEVVAKLQRMRHPELPMTDVVTLLSDCDLVKFAKAAPDPEMCADVHAQARRMVERSKPHFGPAPHGNGANAAKQGARQ